MQPKPWLPKSLEKHNKMTDIENTEMQTKIWTPKSKGNEQQIKMNAKYHERETKKHKTQEMQTEAWSAKSIEQEKEKNIEHAEIQPET